VYPKYDLLSVHFGVLSDVPTVYDNALEMLENVVNPSIRSVLVPLLDNKIPIVERADMGTQLFGTVGCECIPEDEQLLVARVRCVHLLCARGMWMSY
jgi:hypothetical protein